jgi:hypothetical protein
MPRSFPEARARDERFPGLEAGEKFGVEDAVRIDTCEPWCLQFAWACSA